MSHIRSIPPITSTGRRKNNLLGKLLDNNLTHISLGRKSSERRQGFGVGKNSRIFYTPISYKGNTAYLVLSTKGDIFESEVVPQKKGIDQLFSNEFYFPDLIKTYDPLSMKVQQNNGLTIISYNRKKE